MKFKVGGTTNLYIKSSGVSIGSDSPGDLFEVYENNSGNLNAMRVTNAGTGVDSAAGISMHQGAFELVESSLF